MFLFFGRGSPDLSDRMGSAIRNRFRHLRDRGCRSSISVYGQFGPGLLASGAQPDRAPASAAHLRTIRSGHRTGCSVLAAAAAWVDCALRRHIRQPARTPRGEWIINSVPVVGNLCRIGVTRGLHGRYVAHYRALCSTHRCIHRPPYGAILCT